MLGSVSSLPSYPTSVGRGALKGFLIRRQPPLSPASLSSSPCLHTNLLLAHNWHKGTLGAGHHRLLVIACCKEEAGDPNSWQTAAGNREGEDHRAMETVLKLYNAMKGRNLRELSDVLADECRCISNFVSRPSQGKKQVTEFFHTLMTSMGPIGFEIEPTFSDGLRVGIRWRFEWEGKHIPFGKGYAIYTCQTWRGKAYIKNVEMFMEPIFSFGLIRLKVLGTLLPMFERIWSRKLKPNETVVLLLLLSVLVVLLLSKMLFL
ncbi:hypothetical protein EJ110_NYTH13344 [Nymphaea thermarum]|nr:hypothetical protein EJ110_NYTH13344 [Nymphaea thermarum]